jgi:hypothetical protein
LYQKPTLPGPEPSGVLGDRFLAGADRAHPNRAAVVHVVERSNAASTNQHTGGKPRQNEMISSCQPSPHEQTAFERAAQLAVCKRLRRLKVRNPQF